jgi:hypothetical protein
MPNLRLTLTPQALTTAFNPDAEYLDALNAIIELRQGLADRERDLVAEMRGNGTSWSVIGALFNTTRQAAQQRFGS